MADPTPSTEPGRSGLVGKGSPDEPPSTQPAEPSHITPAPRQPQQPAGNENTSPSAVSQKRAGHEEPELALEPDLPTDGRDEVGDAMIRDLPQRPELSEPPSQPKLPDAEPDEKAP